MPRLFKIVRKSIDAKPLTQPTAEYFIAERDRVNAALESIKTLLRDLIDRSPEPENLEKLTIGKRDEKKEIFFNDDEKSRYEKDFKIILERLREFSTALQNYYFVMKQKPEIETFNDQLIIKIDHLKKLKNPGHHAKTLAYLRDMFDFFIIQQTQIHSVCRHVLAENAKMEIENQERYNRLTCTMQ